VLKVVGILAVDVEGWRGLLAKSAKAKHPTGCSQGNFLYYCTLYSIYSYR
jgi:hypothetical protein